MANEVTITVVGRDRTGGLFSGVSKRANTAFGEVRTVVQRQMAGAASDAEAGGRSVGERLMSGASSGVASRVGQFTSEVTSSMTTAGDSAGAGFGDAVVRSAESLLRDGKGRFISALSSSDEAETEGRNIGTRLASGLMNAITSGTAQVRNAFQTVYRDAAGDAEEGGRSVGTRFSAGLRAAVVVGSDAVRGALTGHWGSLGNDADRDGRNVGSKLMTSVGEGLKSAAGAVTDGLGKAFSMAASAAGPILIAALVTVGAGVGLALSAAIGGALTMGLGAAFVGIGAMLVSQNEEIKAQFAKTGSEIKQIMTDASKPLVPVFKSALDEVKSLVKDFKPTFEGVFTDAQGPLKDFTGAFINAFRELKPAVEPIMDAFSGLLDTIGPSLKGTFQDIASALTDLSQVVLENKTVIGGIFVGLLQAIPLVINGLSMLTGLFSSMVGVLNGLLPVASGIFNNMAQAVLSFAERFLGTLRTMGEALANVPGMEEFSRKLVSGLDTAIGKIGEWKVAAQAFDRQIEIQANINDLTMKLDQAKAQLNDPDLTKERRAELTANIAALETAKAKAVQELGDPKLVAEYKSKLTTDIATLQERINTARKELKDPELTKERKSKLNADIAALKSQVAAAKQALASIPDKTVTVTVRTVGDTSIYRAGNVQASTRARGGIIGAAGGGPRSSLTLVGEQGPELVKLPFGSTVVPNGQSERMLAQGGGSGGVTVNLYVQGSIRSDRDLIALIRDEFVNGGFRGAVATP